MLSLRLSSSRGALQFRIQMVAFRCSGWSLGLGFGVWGLGVGGWGLELVFRISGLGFRVRAISGLGFRVRA